MAMTALASLGKNEIIWQLAESLLMLKAKLNSAKMVTSEDKVGLLGPETGL